MKKQIIIGIASLPERVECLKDTIDSLYEQVDKIVVGLNNYEEIPDFLKKDKIESYLLDNSLGDAAKFYKVDDYKGHFYFACDDDLIYSENFIETLINHPSPVAGVHGASVIYPCKNYYTDRVVYHGLHTLDEDREVDVVATCACKIDLEVVNLSTSDFPTPNMADIYLANVCKHQKIIPVILKRKQNELYSYNAKMSDKYTIYDELSRKPTPIHCSIINEWRNVNKTILTIIPFFNVEDVLKLTIEGILQQTYKNIQLCLVDDCSTDKSLSIAKAYEHLPNVTVLQNSQNVGPYLSLNKALKHFKEKEWDYFHFHGGDDVSDLRRFEKVLEYLESSNNLVGTKTTFVRVHFDTNEIAYENGRQHITTSEGIAFYSREVFEKLGYFHNTRYSGDTEYFRRVLSWIQASGNSYLIGSHEEPLYVAYLRNGRNLTTQIPIVNRSSYYKKINEEIQQMIISKNFYRDCSLEY